MTRVEYIVSLACMFIAGVGWCVAGLYVGIATTHGIEYFALGICFLVMLFVVSDIKIRFKK
ncbi:hypothetical protein FJY94_01485 [Candidatus Kaiserbacteria bacterium]|nr:hypothetical protein [Candidatus Kaiserbacteria bacterium]